MTNPLTPPASPPESHEARASHSEALQRCGALLKDENFAWFLEVGLGSKLKESHDAALDITKAAFERDQSAHVHDALVKLSTWTKERHRQALDYMNSR